MWTRKELKGKAKEIVKKSYWKVVLVSLIMILISGGLGAGSSYRYGSNEASSKTQSVIEDTTGNIVLQNEVHAKPSAALIAGIVVGVLIALTIFMAVGIVINAFVINPLLTGIRRFFSHELKDSTKVREVAFAFDHSYMNVVKTMFFRDLYTFFWSLLLIIPGIVKGYEYRMIPYLLGDDPEMSKEEAFARSKEMMNGQKWNAFVLDLSFIGWNILSLFTLGLLSVFYVAPYENLTHAALYNRLAGKDLDPIDVYPALEE